MRPAQGTIKGVSPCAIAPSLSPRSFRSPLPRRLPRLALSGCARDQAAERAAAPPAPQVPVARVIARTMTDSEMFTGRFEAVDRVDMRPRVTGYISSVNFAEGSEVKKGEVLFVIDPRPYEADLKRAQAQLDQARSQLTLAKSEQDRATSCWPRTPSRAKSWTPASAAPRRRTADVAAAKAALDHRRAESELHARHRADHRPSSAARRSPPATS